MIKELKSKIFLLIMISLSIVTIGIISLFTFYNYRNTLKTSAFFIDRIHDIEEINLNKPRLDEFEKKIENHKQEVKSHIRLLIFSAIGTSAISLIVIYIIASKLSEIIVEPVEQTFLKQVQFISDASHELKTPLAVIEANADVLEGEIGNNKWLKYIQNEIESMDKLINELLLLAKVENLDNTQNSEEFNISQETELCVSVFESMAFEKNVNIKTNIDENIKFNGDRDDIKHILSTLVDNAIKHTKNHGTIEVILRKQKDNLLIEVRNPGEPIPVEEREKIFERFYRVDKARNREEKRYGLGLAIAKSTVEKYRVKLK